MKRAIIFTCLTGLLLLRYSFWPPTGSTYEPACGKLQHRPSRKARRRIPSRHAGEVIPQQRAQMEAAFASARRLDRT